MRLLLGVPLLIAAFAGSYALTDLGIVGYFNAPALVLIGIGPIAVAILAYEWRELVSYLGLLGKAFTFDERASTQAMNDALAQVSTAMRDGKQAEAARVIERSTSPGVKNGALLLLKHYDRAALREVFQTWAQTQLSNVRRAEDFFLTMARAAPAFGLIGTILGFIDLLRHLKDSESLGPGMAMALTATLYGIASSYCLYHPLAKALGALARKMAQELRLCEQGLLLIHDGRSSHDVRAASA